MSRPARRAARAHARRRTGGFAALLAAGLLAAMAGPACGQDAAPIRTPRSWTYQTYDRNAANAAGYGGPGVSHVRLEGQEGDYRFTIIAPGLATCYAAPLAAAVTQTASAIIITTVPRIPGCEEVRFVIKADGSGGRRERRVGTNWRWDRLDRGLVARD